MARHALTTYCPLFFPCFNIIPVIYLVNLKRKLFFDFRKEKSSMKNIYFIEAKSPGAHIFSRTALPRLGSVLLGTILKEKGYNVKVFIEDIAPPPISMLDDADMVCISSITSTANRALQLAERFSRKGVPVAVGGPHSTFLPDESLRYADYVVRGEGEETLPELLDHINGNRSIESIRGLSYKMSDGTIKHNPGRELVSDLDAYPIPDFNIVYKWAEKAKVIPIATSRGCPFACRFCSVIQMFGRKYRHKSIDRILSEIEAASPQNRHVFFIDDNFTANKKRTKTLLRAMLERNIKIEWSAQVRTDVAKDPELLDLMRKAGCFSVYIGFESINPKTLALYNKGQELKDIEYSIKEVKKHSINIHGMFVLGSDTDDIETIRNTEKFAKRLNIESVQFMMLTPLPGTPVFEDMQNSGRLLHTDWSKYDAHHAVFEPKLMTPFELHTETLKAMGRFYSWPTILRNLWQFDLFYCVIGLYGKRSVKKSLDQSKKYLDGLREIIMREFDKKTEMIRQYIPQRQGKIDRIILNASALEEDESRFFSTFFASLGKKLEVSKENLMVAKNALSIMPVMENIKERHEKGKQQIADFCSKYKDSVKAVNIEAISLYRMCVDLGVLLNANTRKIRKAYEQALASIGGHDFECNRVMIFVGQN
jgi:radical SAM superfamily enzyme YgiQ (UPF0313 family)